MGKLKILLSCLITICITIAMLSYCGHLLDPDESETAMDAIKAFHMLDENSLEVIVYGSSHAWRGCDSMEMYRKYGLAAYNYGCNWQYLNTTLLFLQDSLRTQTPKVVCIDTYSVGVIELDTDMDGQIYYTGAIKDFEGKREYLKQCFGTDVERYASYYLPIIMFHDNWNQIDRESFAKSSPERWLNSMGYCGSNGVTSVTIGDYTQFTQRELPEESLEVLDKMVAACKAKGVQIVFYTCPYQGEFAFEDAMTRYANENGCAYLNLFAHMEEMQLDPENDFQDAGHLNDSGAAKVADFLGEYIVNNYSVTDMRQIGDNIWARNLQ